MPQMISICAYSLSTVEYSHIVPHDLLVTEAGPPMLFAFINKLIRSSAGWCNEQGLASDRVVKSQWTVCHANVLKKLG